MAARKKKTKKLRTDFRKNRTARTRDRSWTREFDTHGFEETDTSTGERISGKGELARKRTIRGVQADDTDQGVLLDVDEQACECGRVLSVRGLLSDVEATDGAVYRCATRRLLKTLSTDQRHVVAAGDMVLFRPEGTDEGIIERIEPRYGVVSRTSRGKQHVIVANVDQVVIVASAAQPHLKPNLIDRLIVTCEKGGVRPLICINKIDLIDVAQLEPLVGVYCQLGYEVLLVSAQSGRGIDMLRREVQSRASVFAGQSGVGKSSLLNEIDPRLSLAVGSVSEETQKGRHTTTTARLLPIAGGGYVVDTPGVRQFQLWDVIPAEVAGFYRDLRPFVSNCRFPDCSHTHETDCAVKDAVADDLIDVRRYESYLHLHEGIDE